LCHIDHNVRYHFFGVKFITLSEPRMVGMKRIKEDVRHCTLTRLIMLSSRTPPVRTAFENIRQYNVCSPEQQMTVMNPQTFSPT